MVALQSVLSMGLRRLDAEGRPTGEPAELTDLAAAAALYVVDLEMSGPNPQVHEILDIAGVRAALAPGLPEEESWSARVRPKRIGNAVPAALKVVGYSPKAWKTALDLEAAMERFATVGRDAVVAGWGMAQDLAFLAEAFRALGSPWPFALAALDVQVIARALLRGNGEVDRFNLGHVADRLGIGRMGEHGALADAYATYDVLVKLVERVARLTAERER
ncbi:3'-5' exonuclease [Tepidiforma bonchosmolovskayae]|uniref:3'-5' exonuclease n=1 Tax=Tepidiforma bonchosmolovskayae TaxID=2601677 RepID=A0ABX6C6R1_9CHLR|nr:3'-5' exonuclease [Tepidiforma bonchosmolovskayae]QFG03664.1 3'-5' exonuclease [Tepidiforma bonchosmolovskayae]